MQDHFSTESLAGASPAYVTLALAQSEAGVSRGTLKKYLALLSIEPVCFHIGTRCLSISRSDLERVKHLKRQPSVLASLPTSPETSTR